MVKTEHEKYLKSTTPKSASSAPAIAIKSQTKTIAPKPFTPFVPQCTQILGVLAGRDDTSLFKEPVDVAVAPDYFIRIDKPMDFGTIRGMLVDGRIDSPAEFALYVRRVFANCLTYNYQLRGGIEVETTKVIRLQARTILNVFEDSWCIKFPGVNPVFPLMNECIDEIDELLKLPSHNPDVLCAVDNFMSPVSKYYGGEFPDGYVCVQIISFCRETVKIL